LILGQIGSGFKPLNGDFEFPGSARTDPANLLSHAAQHCAAQLLALPVSRTSGYNPGDKLW
jgi:hypothetical protein